MRKNLGRVIIAAIAVLLTLSLCLSYFNGCGKKEEVIKIGAIVPLTGDNAVYGTALKQGMDIALEEINKDGGIGGSRLRIVFEDDQAQAQKGIDAFLKLTTSDHVPLVLGAMFSAVTLAIAPIAEQKQVVLLSPTSSATDLTSAGDYIFRIYPSDSYDGQFLADFSIDSLHDTTCSILSIRVASVEAIVGVFRERFVSRGGRIVTEDSYSEGETDFRTQIKRIGDGNAQFVFLPGYLREMATQMRQFHELGIRTPVVSISTYYDPQVFELAGDAANGVIFSTPAYDASNKDSLMSIFVTDFMARYGSEPNIWAGYGYDVVRVASEALRSTALKSQLTSTNIKAALYNIAQFPGVTGSTTFDRNGDVQKTLRVMIASDRKFRPYSSMD